MRRHSRGVAPDALFYAEQNARLVANAEAYYRAMFGSRVSSWNLRDQHMAETLDALDAHLSRDNGPPKIVVWAHNSHLGDARATELSRSGELNLGQLVRERHAHEAVLVGFSTFGGTVTAASDWGAPAERKTVREGTPRKLRIAVPRDGRAEFHAGPRGRQRHDAAAPEAATRHRRHLPARRPSGKATTSTRRSGVSSTRSCTTT